ncbi:unnamed protein product [Porites evermanni]|uniref:Uncharacterized protein n=1 Tax=Porites evermanni TaxID=104178 RepID=A0ABN8RT90_9CNID|nr:unnamed protein product [Porites evermanni]
MYNVYVTNKSENVVYVRLKSQELSSINPTFHQELHKLVRRGRVPDESYIQTFLVRYGFKLIPYRETLSFSTVACSGRGVTRILYASLYARSELWAMDEEVDFLRFGCLFVRSHYVSVLKTSFSFKQVNPEPVWIGAKSGDPVPTNIIKASSGLEAEYFGRLTNGVPCGVTVTANNKCSRWNTRDGPPRISGDILRDTGHQLYRVKIGDPVPPNAVIVGLSSSLGSLYLGRVGGKVPCSVSAVDGKIKHFLRANNVERNGSASGEILVLTNGIAA